LPFASFLPSVFAAAAAKYGKYLKHQEAGGEGEVYKKNFYYVCAATAAKAATVVQLFE